MPDSGSPNLLRSRLAAELRRLRERSGLTNSGAADLLGWSASKLSRIERNRIRVSPADLDRLLALYGSSPEHNAQLLALAAESRESSPLSVVGAIMPDEQVELLHLESEAVEEWNWEPLIVPGLLQIEQYTRAIMAGWVSTFVLPESQIESRVDGRRLRQSQMTSRVPPLRLSVVIDESVLHRRIGTDEVMHNQLEHLAGISESPHVDVRILPARGAHSVLVGAFAYMTFPHVHEIPLPDQVAVELLTRTEFVHDEDETHKYRLTFLKLRESSLSPTESRRMLRETAGRSWA